MKKKMTAVEFISCALSAIACLSLPAKAEFIDDANTDFTLRNFYFNRDYKTPGAPLSKAESWSQAAFIRFHSGYTEGPFAVGLDITGFGAIRLHGDFDNSGNLPQRNMAGNLADNYGRAGATLKLRIAENELKIGLLEPELPVVFRDNTRVLPQTFQGALFSINELAPVKITAGRLWKTSVRASSNSEKIYLNGRPSTQTSNGLTVFGADGKWSQTWSSSYWFSRLDDIYDQHYVSANFNHEVSDNTQLFATASYFDSRQSGRAISGRIDNQVYGLRLGTKHGGHRLSATYQKQAGRDGFPLLFGYTPQVYLVNWTSNIAFWWAGENSWQARYDYDFSKVGIPGLTLMSRYTRGSAALGDPSGSGEYERDIDIGYSVQNDALKGLSFLLRTASVRSYRIGKFDEARFIVEYKFSL